MRFNSLAIRLVAIAAVWTAIAVVVAGVILSSLYRQSAENGFDDRIKSYSEALIGAFSEQGGPLTNPGDLGEPRFETIASGWYWQLSQGDRVVLTSRSLLLQSLEVPAAR